MKWENELITGAEFLNHHLKKIRNDGVSIKVHHWGASQDYSNHTLHEHSYYEACYVLNGKGLYIEGDAIGDVSEGTLILTTPETKHQLMSENGLDLIFIGFELMDTSHAYIQKLFSNVKRPQIYLLTNKERSAAILLWVSLLKLASQENTVFLKNNLDSLAIILFWSLLKDFQKEILAEAPNPVRTPTSILVYRAKLYIIKRLSEPITVKHVADHLHISERHLSRMFNQELGQSFTTFIRKERIRKAGILLSESNLPIKEIAEQTGFSSVHYFTNVFSKEMDMPPGQFRNRFRHRNLIT